MPLRRERPSPLIWGAMKVMGFGQSNKNSFSFEGVRKELG